MKEIGGYIEWEHNSGKMMYDDGILLNCGRRALSYLIKAKGIKRIWIPRLLCDSVLEPFRKGGVDIEFYNIGFEFNPIIDSIGHEEWILLINYYGQLDNTKVMQIAKEHPNIIVDNTQAYYQGPIDGIDTFYSCRKFFGVTDGAILYTKDRINDVLPVDESYNRLLFLFGRFERSASEFYDLYDKNNAVFSDEPIKRMSLITMNTLKGIDYSGIKKKREDNYKFINERLGIINALNIHFAEGPYMYPLYVEDGERIKKELILKKIYVPTLWTDTYKYNDDVDIEYKLAKNTIPIPIDQRYSSSEMKYIVDVVQGLI